MPVSDGTQTKGQLEQPGSGGVNGPSCYWLVQGISHAFSSRAGHVILKP